LNPDTSKHVCRQPKKEGEQPQPQPQPQPQQQPQQQQQQPQTHHHKESSSIVEKEISQLRAEMRVFFEHLSLCHNLAEESCIYAQQHARASLKQIPASTATSGKQYQP
jgi:hypothetical protein